MGFPLLLYGLAEIGNPAFEDDADLAAPTTWDTSLGTNGVNEVVVAEFQSAGDGMPSTRSLRQNTTDGTGGNKAIAAQRFSIPDLLDISRENDVELAIAASLKAESQAGFNNATIRFKQYDGTSDTPGDGSLQAAPSERVMVAGGPVWHLFVGAAKIAPATTRVDVELVYDIARDVFDAGGSVWWDRVAAGGLVDFDKRFRGGFSSRLQAGVFANEGDGETELVRTRGPRTTVDLDVRNVMQGSRLAADLRAFNRWLGRGVGFVSLWRDRDLLTNADEHYQKAHVDPRFRVRLPAGPTRRDYDLRFVASQEGNA